MRTAQRGSVLLSVIAGILILAVIGTVTVSLMTSSVMTAVDGKEALQATYLAESGKEIVRARTAKLSGGALMEEAQALEKLSEGKGIAVSGKGFVKVSLYPSWFRWYEGKLNATASGWYGDAPTGNVELLFIDKNGAKRYRYSQGKPVEGPPDSPADVYLIGRVSDEGSSTYSGHDLTVRAYSGFDFFPQTGGLIGLIDHQKEGIDSSSTTVSKQRFTYDKFEYHDGTATFTNITPLSDEEVAAETFKDKDIVLGQYFRVVCEATTTNGARAALVWHTNGRSSFLSGQNGNAAGGDIRLDDVLSSTLEEESQREKTFGNNKSGDVVYVSLDSSGKIHALSVQGFHSSKQNHFLNREDNSFSPDQWFALITQGKTSQSDLALQISFKPWWAAEDDIFAGLLFRTSFLPNNDALNALGVSGLGMGFVQGKLLLEDTVFYWNNIIKTVSSSPLNPALLPGYQRYDVPDPWGRYLYTPTEYAEDFKEIYTSFPTQLRQFVVIWTYSDDKEQDALNWLALGVIDDTLDTKNFTTLVAEIKEQEGKNIIRGWLASQGEGDISLPLSGLRWPDMNTPEQEKEEKPFFHPIRWAYINTMAKDKAGTPVVKETDNPYEISTPLDLPTQNAHNRVGLFQGSYSINPASPRNMAFRNFAVGLPGGDGVQEVPGLTPGITN